MSITLNLDDFLNDSKSKDPRTSQQEIKSNPISLSKEQEDNLVNIFSGTKGTSSRTLMSGPRDSDYDGNAHPYLKDLQAHRAAIQSKWSKAGSALSRVIVNTPLSVASYLSAIADVEDYNNKDEEVGNLVTNTLEEWKASFNQNYAPIYRKSNEHLALNDFGWWMENGSSLVESIGAFAAAGAVTGGAASWLTGVARLGKAGQALAALGTSTALNQAEGISSAAQVYKDIYKYQMNEGRSSQEAKEIASKAAARTVDVNRANILLNLTSANMFIKAGGGIAGSGKQLIKNVSAKNTRKRIAGEAAQEFLEEEINLIADKAGRAFGEGRTYTTSDIMKDLKTAEAAEAGLLGAIGGAGQTAVAAGIGNVDSEYYQGKYAKQKKAYEEQQKFVQMWEGILESSDIPKMSNVFASKDSIDKAQKQVTDIFTKADKENRDLTEEDKEKIKELTKSDLINQAAIGLQSGTIGKLIDIYESIANLTEEEAASKGLVQKDVKEGDPEHYVSRANEALKTLETVANHYSNAAKYRFNQIPIAINRTERDSISNKVDDYIDKANNIESRLEQDKTKGKPENKADKAALTLTKAKIRNLNSKLEILDNEYQNLTNPKKVKEKVNENYFNDFSKSIDEIENSKSAESLFKNIEESELSDNQKEELNKRLIKKVSDISSQELKEKQAEAKKKSKATAKERIDKNNSKLEDRKKTAQEQLQLKFDNFNPDSDRVISSDKSEQKTQIFNKKLAKKLQKKLEKLYPEIKLNITENPQWEKGDNIFNQEEYNNQIQYRLKAVDILTSDRAKQAFEKGKKNNWDLNKILTELQVPKEQKQLILDKNINNREEIITSLLADNSFVVEINTATTKKESSRIYGNYEQFYTSEGTYSFNPIYNSYKKAGKEITKEEYDKAFEDFKNIDKTENTDYYSNLTVPGGTNYTENEIATPAILPNIKGHAQFSTDNGIGWFRSDDKVDEEFLRTNKSIEDVKTRRILEVQSDWGQKRRNSNEKDIDIKYDIQQIINDLESSGELKIDCS